MCCIIEGSKSQDRQEFLKPLTDKVFTEDLPDALASGESSTDHSGRMAGVGAQSAQSRADRMHDPGSTRPDLSGPRVEAGRAAFTVQLDLLRPRGLCYQGSGFRQRGKSQISRQNLLH